jgi:hypothetical protein
MDLDHLVGHRLHPNRVEIGFRLLARNLAIGPQSRNAMERPAGPGLHGRAALRADARPASIREPAAFRAEHVDGLGTFTTDGPTILLARPRPDPEATYPLPWTGRTVRLVA